MFVAGLGKTELKFADTAGGYAYVHSDMLDSATRNRFIYWSVGLLLWLERCWYWGIRYRVIVAGFRCGYISIGQFGTFVLLSDNTRADSTISLDGVTVLCIANCTDFSRGG